MAFFSIISPTQVCELFPLERNSQNFSLLRQQNWLHINLPVKNIANDFLLMLYTMFLLPVNFVVFTMNKIMFCSNAVCQQKILGGRIKEKPFFYDVLIKHYLKHFLTHKFSFSPSTLKELYNGFVGMKTWLVTDIEISWLNKYSGEGEMC